MPRASWNFWRNTSDIDDGQLSCIHSVAGAWLEFWIDGRLGGPHLMYPLIVLVPSAKSICGREGLYCAWSPKFKGLDIADIAPNSYKVLQSLSPTPLVQNVGSSAATCVGLEESCLSGCLSMHRSICLSFYLPTYHSICPSIVHTYIHTYMHTYIHV